LRVLCLDIEGGYGGSSRSLFESLRHLDRDRAAAEVWCRLPGPVEARYRALGIPCRPMPDMPKVSSLPRLSRNLYAYAHGAAEFLRARPFREALAHEVTSRFDLVHFNHEALFLLARWLRPRTRAPFVMHIRTNLHDSPFARMQSRISARSVDRFVFITENERATFERQAGRPVEGRVIYNIAAPPEDAVEPHPEVPRDGRFKVACLSSYSWQRGLDRLVDVAAELDRLGHGDVLFVMAGEMRLSRSLPGQLGAIGRRGGSLRDYVEARGLADMFHFLGHVDAPERVLAACDALAKPSRENNPWGRDVLEALAAGRPVLACGSYGVFVEDGVTGVLLPRFEAAEMARRLMALADDREACRRLGEAGRERAARLCDGPARAAELLAVWEAAARPAA